MSLALRLIKLIIGLEEYSDLIIGLYHNILNQKSRMLLHLLMTLRFYLLKS
jgi:hypothetical protein